VRRRQRLFDRTLLVYLGILIAVSLLFLGLRYAYFGKLLPNTAYAKVALSGLILKRGLFYFLHFCLVFVTPAILLLGTPCLLAKGARPGVWPAAVMIGGFGLYAIVTGGDFMAMGRFLAPAAPYFAILFAALFERLRERTSAPQPALLALALLLLAVQVLPAFNLHLVPDSLLRALNFRWMSQAEVRSEYEQWQFMDENRKRWAAAGGALRRYADKGDSLLCLYIGAIGYYSGLYIYDEAGLIDPDVASRPEPTSAGHDRTLGPQEFLQYFLPRRPTFFQVRVLADYEVAPYIGMIQAMGLPPGYQVKTLPLETLKGEREPLTLLIVERE
jgi:hypothetical protein